MITPIKSLSQLLIALQLVTETRTEVEYIGASDYVFIEFVTFASKNKEFRKIEQSTHVFVFEFEGVRYTMLNKKWKITPDSKLEYTHITTEEGKFLTFNFYFKIK